MTRQELRQYLAERLLAGLTDAGWSQSRFHPDLIGKDARSLVHLSFAISVGQTQGRLAARVEDGAHCNTAVRVRWVHKLVANGQVEDYDAALGEEQRLIKAALSDSVRPELSIWFDTVDEPRVLGAEGAYVAGTVVFETGHILELQ